MKDNDFFEWVERIFRYAYETCKKEPFHIPTIIAEVKELRKEFVPTEAHDVEYYFGSMVQYLERKCLIEEVETEDPRNQFWYKLTNLAFTVAKYPRIIDYETAVNSDKKIYESKKKLEIALFENQIETNRKISGLTFWVMVGGLAAAVYYILEIVKVDFLEITKKDSVFPLWFIRIFAVVLIAAAFVLILHLRPSKNNNPAKNQ